MLLLTGWPQGSVLDILSVYTHCLGDVVQCHGSKYHLYAADSKIFITSLDLCVELQTYISICLVHFSTFGLNRHITLSQSQIPYLPSHSWAFPVFLNGNSSLAAEAKTLNLSWVPFVLYSSSSANSVNSALKIDPEFDHFSAHLLLHLGPSPFTSYLFYFNSLTIVLSAFTIVSFFLSTWQPVWFLQILILWYLPLFSIYL